MADGKSFFDQAINNDTKRYESNRKKMLLVKEMTTQPVAC